MLRSPRRDRLFRELRIGPLVRDEDGGEREPDGRCLLVSFPGSREPNDNIGHRRCRCGGPVGRFFARGQRQFPGRLRSRGRCEGWMGVGERREGGGYRCGGWCVGPVGMLSGVKRQTWSEMKR
jgi:hypothetical protein